MNKIDKSKVKKMWVWGRGYYVGKTTRFVIDILKNGSCLAVGKFYEQSFLEGGNYETVLWSHCEEIKEPVMRPMTLEEKVIHVAKLQAEGKVVILRSKNLISDNILYCSGFTSYDKYEDTYAIYDKETVGDDFSNLEWIKFEVEG